MRNKRKWLTFAVVLTGLLVVGLLAFTINRGPLATGFRSYDDENNRICLWCGENKPTDVWDVMGTGLIILLLLLVPSGHLVLLIAAAIHLNRPSKPRPSVPNAVCPHCGKEVEVEWKACPYCSGKL